MLREMDAIEKSARVAAIETTASGLNRTFTPTYDISVEPRWEYFRKDGWRPIFST